jgi:3-hydroxyisobutyrate dehydrogenase-like beta-hydroxyacid dehydrogenase
VLDRDREAHRFTIRNAHKDTRYLESMASASGARHPLATAILGYYALAEEKGSASDYVPMLADIVADANGVSLGESQQP